MNIYSIYKATNTANEKVYIGFATNFYNRKRTHKTDSKTKQTKFHRAIRKYGWDAFNWEIIYQSKDKEHTLKTMEPFFISQYNSCELGYNITIGGEGATCPKTTEWKNKISNTRKSSESCKLASITNLKKANEANKLHPPANLGRKFSDEAKKSFSIERKSRTYIAVVCPHCGKTGGQISMNRWHFDNCKFK
jgi:group I intron endonuclease